MAVNTQNSLETGDIKTAPFQHEHERPVSSTSKTKGIRRRSNEENDGKEHRGDRNPAKSNKLNSSREPSFHRLARSSTVMSSLELLTAQQEIVGQRQVNKEESRRLNHLSLKLEHEKKLINQHRSALESDKSALNKEKKEVQESRRQLKLKEEIVEEQRSKNENERAILTKWHKDLDTREKVTSQKEKKLLKNQQEFEEYKKNEMLLVHKQRQADIDEVKEERERLRLSLMKEIDERRDLERSFIVRDQEALRQDRISHQKKVDLEEEGFRSREVQLKEWEQSLLHERRLINQEKDKVELMRHSVEVERNQKDLDQKQKEQEAQLTSRLLLEKKHIDDQLNVRKKSKLQNEISKKQFEVEQRQNKYEQHNLATESEIEAAKKERQKKLDQKEKIVELRAEQKARILRAQQRNWETTQFEKIKSLSTSIVS